MGKPEAGQPCPPPAVIPPFGGYKPFFLPRSARRRGLVGSLWSRRFEFALTCRRLGERLRDSAATAAHPGAGRASSRSGGTHGTPIASAVSTKPRNCLLPGFKSCIHGSLSSATAPASARSAERRVGQDRRHPTIVAKR